MENVFTDDEWDEIEDGLNAMIEESYGAAEQWRGRRRESRYRAEALRTQLVLNKVRQVRGNEI